MGTSDYYSGIAVARVKVSVQVERPCQGTGYTGWLVKKLLGFETGGDNFETSWKIKPRSSRVTGLFLSGSGDGDSVIHVNYCMGLQDHDYEFLIATTRGEDFLDKVLNTLMSGEHNIRFSKGLFKVTLVDVSVIDVNRTYLKRLEEAVEALLNGHEVKLSLMSPTVLADPLSPYHPATTAPSPMTIFSVPIRTRSSLMKTGRKEYVRSLLAVHKSLAVKPEYLRTVKLANVTCYPGLSVAGIVGYLRLKPLEPIEANRELVRDAIFLSEVLGVGLAGEGGLGWVTFKAD